MNLQLLCLANPCSANCVSCKPHYVELSDHYGFSAETLLEDSPEALSKVILKLFKAKKNTNPDFVFDTISPPVRFHSAHFESCCPGSQDYISQCAKHVEDAINILIEKNLI
jgi:hypothetical protein